MLAVLDLFLDLSTGQPDTVATLSGLASAHSSPGLVSAPLSRRPSRAISPPSTHSLAASLHCRLFKMVKRDPTAYPLIVRTIYLDHLYARPNE